LHLEEGIAKDRQIIANHLIVVLSTPPASTWMQVRLHGHHPPVNYRAQGVND
jgi:hypothetical protein